MLSGAEIDARVDERLRPHLEALSQTHESIAPTLPRILERIRQLDDLLTELVPLVRQLARRVADAEDAIRTMPLRPGPPGLPGENGARGERGEQGPAGTPGPFVERAEIEGVIQVIPDGESTAGYPARISGRVLVVNQ